MATLREMRERQGLNQEQLGDKLGVHVQFVSNMERGIGPIPPKHFKKLARLLDVTTHAFIEISVERYKARLYKRMGLK